ncbi:MAG TPA: class I SAM-dependent methyltransferase [Solirubrobacteraceae bacterium]|jgi:2-polyprenyl-3-methyl-5-hydroxy-6-metoxy-1,4-benzoquinol methylase|nr:class I SAM-dependent methyltransferase [Solirubrobacteraceae bacterium]
MPTRAYYEERWQGLARGLEPSDLELRAGFLREHVAAGERVLDLGCGEGRFAAELERIGVSVLAADVAEEPLRRARELHPQLELCLLGADGGWELPDAVFDAVWAGEVIEHVADTAAWLSEVRRVLRPGGRLLLSTPAHGRLEMLRLALSPRALSEHFDPRGEHLRFYTRATLRELLEDFRFEAVDVRACGPPWARRLLLARAVRSRF